MKQAESAALSGARLVAAVRGVLRRDGVPWLLLAIVIGTVLRALWIAHVNVDPNDGRLDDSVFYYNVGQSVAFHGRYEDPWQFQPSAAWPPGYPMILAAVFRLFGWHLVLTKFVNLLCAGGTVALTYLIARRLFDGRVAFLAALCLAAFPGQIYFSTLVMTETVFAFTFLLLLFCTLIWTVERQARWWQVLALGSIAGSASLIRTEGVLLAGVVLLLWLFVVRPWRLLLWYTPVLLFGMVAIIAPWTIRNAVQFHEFIPLRDGANYTLSAGLNPDFSEDDLNKLYIFAPRRKPVGDSALYWSKHPWEIPSFVWLKLKILYNNDEEGITWAQKAPLYLSKTEVKLWSRVSNAYLFSIGTLAMLGAPLCVGSNRKERLTVVVFAVGWSLAFAFVIPAARYHFPVGPLLAISAAGLVVAGWDLAAGVRGRDPPLAARHQASSAKG